MHEAYRARLGVMAASLEAMRGGAADVPFVMAAERAPENSPYVWAWTADQHEAALREQGTCYFVFRTAPDGRPVGFAIVRGADSPHRSVELMRFVITEKGRGHGRAALRLMKRFAFDTLGAHRLWLDVVEDNERALALYESEGFVLEGRLRECSLKDGRYETMCVLSLLEHEPGAAGPW